MEYVSRVDALPLAIIEDDLISHFLGDATNRNNRPTPPGLAQAVIIKESPNPRARPRRILLLLLSRGIPSCRGAAAAAPSTTGVAVVAENRFALPKNTRTSQRVLAAARWPIEAEFTATAFLR